jgi:dTDP-4-amino-4,6-dideoxygalactose transaminase
MPITLESEELVSRVQARLLEEDIVPRRYFHPSLNAVSVFAPQASLPVSERIARTNLCLPLYDSLSKEHIQLICRLVASS